MIYTNIIFFDLYTSDKSYQETKDIILKIVNEFIKEYSNIDELELIDLSDDEIIHFEFDGIVFISDYDIKNENGFSTCKIISNGTFSKSDFEMFDDILNYII